MAGSRRVGIRFRDNGVGGAMVLRAVVAKQTFPDPQLRVYGLYRIAVPRPLPTPNTPQILQRIRTRNAGSNSAQATSLLGSLAPVSLRFSRG